MQLTYQKPGTDHPMYGKVEFIVSDGMTPLCYKTAEGYLPVEGGSTASVQAKPQSEEVKSKPLYVLSFKVNGEKEEATFTSKKKLDKTIELYNEKAFITDIKTKEYKTV